jgi:hypothetical protein
VIDVQVIVPSLEPQVALMDAFGRVAFGQRPGDWNLRDHVPAFWDGDPRQWDKLVVGVGPLDDERPGECARSRRR